VVRDEIARLATWEERHRRLIARVSIALGLTFVVDIIGAVVMWRLERHADQTDIHGLGDAFFFSTVQLLTISSQFKNPLTAAGKVVDVALEIWALAVVSALAGSFAAFFVGGDQD
jgi:hypothetical protein